MDAEKNTEKKKFYTLPLTEKTTIKILPKEDHLVIPQIEIVTEEEMKNRKGLTKRPFNKKFYPVVD